MNSGFADLADTDSPEMFHVSASKDMILHTGVKLAERYELRPMPGKNRREKGSWGVWDTAMKRWVLNAADICRGKAERIMIRMNLHERNK